MPDPRSSAPFPSSSFGRFDDDTDMEPIKKEEEDFRDLGALQPLQPGNHPNPFVKSENFVSPARGPGTSFTPSSLTLAPQRVQRLGESLEKALQRPRPEHQIPSDAIIIVDRELKTTTLLDKDYAVRCNGQGVCRLYRDASGNYYPTPLAHSKTKNRQEEWKQHLRSLGVNSFQTFYDKHEECYDEEGKLAPEHKYIKIQDQYGFRRREVLHRYKFEFEAGQTLPDIMIKQGNIIHWVNRHPGDSFAGKTFDEFRKIVENTKPFKPGVQICLKSVSGIFSDYKVLDSWTTDGADIRFAAFAGETRAHNSRLPGAIVNLGGDPTESGGRTPDLWVSIKYINTNATTSNLYMPLQLGQLTSKTLLLDRSGNSYVTPGHLYKHDRETYKFRCTDAQLPVTIGQQSLGKSQDRDRAPVLIFDSKNPILYEPGAYPYEAEPPRENSTANYFIAHKGKYTSAAEFERTHEELPKAAAAVFNIGKDHFKQGWIEPESRAFPLYDNRGPSNRAVGL